MLHGFSNPFNQWKRREESWSNTMPIEQTFYELWCITYMRFLFNLFFFFKYLAPDTEEEIAGYKEW